MSKELFPPGTVFRFAGETPLYLEGTIVAHCRVQSGTFGLYIRLSALHDFAVERAWHIILVDGAEYEVHKHYGMIAL